MLTLNFTPFPVLETERLRLRQTTLDDAQVIFAMLSSTTVMQYIPSPLATTVKEAEDYIHSLDERMKNNECINWTIVNKESGAVVGTMGFYRMKRQHYRTEVGYMLLPVFYGKGYASEALQRLVDFGLNDLGFHSLEAVIYPENKGSIRVVEKCGFVREAYFKEKEYHNGTFVDKAIYSKLND